MFLKRLSNVSLQLPATAMVALCLSTLVGAAAQAQALQGVRVTEITQASHPFTTWHCARQPIQVRMLGQFMEVVVGGKSQILRQAVSASGARYVAPNDPGTEFWSKGGQANVTWSGTELPVCVEDGSLMVPMRASGNEPFWAVDYDRWSVTLSEPGKPPRSFDVKGQSPQGDGWRIQAESGQANLYLDINPQLCVDNMSGQPRPYTVSMNLNEQTMQGCGGDPARLLQGVRWQLKAIDGKAVTTQASLEFLADNRVAGSNGCNRIMGSYALSGEGLSFSKLASTRMACEPAIMKQADIVDQYLSGVRGFAFDDQGALVLKAEKGELLWQAIDTATKS